MGSDWSAREPVCGLMWRSGRSAACDDVPLSARLGFWDEGHGKPRKLLAGAVVGRQLLSVCRDEQWCVRSTRSRGRAVGYPVLMRLATLPSRCVVDSYSFPNELLFAGQMASFIQVTAVQPALQLAGWQSWCAWLPEDSSVCQGAVSFICGSRQRRRAWESGLLRWLSCCWLGRSVDCCMNRGWRAAMWVSPHFNNLENHTTGRSSILSMKSVSHSSPLFSYKHFSFR